MPSPRPSRRTLGAVDLPRIVIAVIMVFALVTTLSWLQGRFDQSDHRKALELVKSYRAIPNGPTIPDVIRSRHPAIGAHEISWTSEITSGCLGHLRVHAYVPKTSEAPAATYAFDVDLTGPSIHPTDPPTVEILTLLTSPPNATLTSSASARRPL